MPRRSLILEPRFCVSVLDDQTFRITANGSVELTPAQAQRAAEAIAQAKVIPFAPDWICAMCGKNVSDHPLDECAVFVSRASEAHYRLTLTEATHQLRDLLTRLQALPHKEHEGPLCPICGLTTALLMQLEDSRW